MPELRLSVHDSRHSKQLNSGAPQPGPFADETAVDVVAEGAGDLVTGLLEVEVGPKDVAVAGGEIGRPDTRDVPVLPRELRRRKAARRSRISA
jgi:hypothetical protein